MMAWRVVQIYTSEKQSYYTHLYAALLHVCVRMSMYESYRRLYAHCPYWQISHKKNWYSYRCIIYIILEWILPRSLSLVPFFLHISSLCPRIGHTHTISFFYRNAFNFVSLLDFHMLCAYIYIRVWPVNLLLDARLSIAISSEITMIARIFLVSICSRLYRCVKQQHNCLYATH